VRLGDLSLAELAATDMRHWHELAQAVTAWRNGQQAGRPAGEAEAEEAG
jgi:hypothetical protein